MLRRLSDLEGFTIGATDGAIGRVRDFYFDDESWVIRYLIVETDERHGRKRVLISPISLLQPDWAEKVLPVSISRAQVVASTDIDTDKPVSRQHEMGYLGYYGYANYWGGGGLWGAGLYPDMLQAGGANARRDSSEHNLYKRKIGTLHYASRHHHEDPHLRSANEVMRYYVHATDGDIGHVQGMLVDEKTWAIHYVVVDTSNWWLGNRVLVAPEWIDDIYWAESKLMVALTRQSLREAPKYDPNAPPTHEQERLLHAFYGHSGYWPHP